VSTLILHLSDFHFNSANASLALRSRQLVAAALSRVERVSDVHIVASGDLANRGENSEFDLAHDFLSSVSNEFERSISVSPEIMICAGNHDCDFTVDQSLRNLVLKGIGSDGAISNSVAQALSTPLEGFFALQSRLNPRVERINPWCSRVATNGAVPVEYFLINSSVCSTVRESPGKLIVPTNSIPEPSTGGRVVFVMHHPLNWLDHENARALAQLAATNADLFLMGHEHELVGQLSTDLYTGNGVAVMKGHVLFHSSGSEDSGFHVVHLDPDMGFITYAYRWSDTKYEPWEQKSTPDYSPWCTGNGNGKLALSLKVMQTLDSVGANFTHRKKDHLTLQDLFVWPALKPVGANGSSNLGEGVDGISAELLLDDPELASEVVVIRGEEQFGKSALARVLALSTWKRGFYPLLLSASKVASWRERSLHERIEVLASEFYGSRSRSDYLQLERSQRVLFIDEFDLAQVEKGYVDGLKVLSQFFGRIYVFVDEYPGVQVALSDFLANPSIRVGKVFQLLPCDLDRRIQIIERWLQVGDHDADLHQLKVTAARLSKVVDETLGRNLIPSVPIFVLIILQRAELARDLDTVVKSGSHGFLYESLILHALSNKVSQMGVGAALTYLTSFARLLDSASASFVTQTQFERFHVDHCTHFDLDVSVYALQRQLIDAEILSGHGSEVSFKYPFHFYYFTARSLAQIEDWSELESRIDYLVDAIHTERNANILLFLAHLGRNPKVADKIIGRAERMFDDYGEADLFSRIGVFEKFDASSVRSIIYEGKRSEVIGEREVDSRNVEAAALELKEMADAKLSKKLNDALSLNAAFKTLQVLGQVLRNHGGEIPAGEKIRIARACISLGLRMLGFVFVIVEEDGHEMIKHRIAKLESENRSISPTEVQEKVGTYLTSLLADVSVGAILGIANAIGSEELSITIEKALSGSPSGAFLRLITELEHFSEFPESAILQFERDQLASADILPNIVFRRFLVRRFYLFPVREELRRNVLQRFKITPLPFAFRGQRRREIGGGDHSKGP
jgi:hypothetical protein